MQVAVLLMKTDYDDKFSFRKKSLKIMKFEKFKIVYQGYSARIKNYLLKQILVFKI